MKDLYFKNYNSDYDDRKSNEQDMFQDRLNQQKYEQIVRRQKNSMEYLNDYEDFVGDVAYKGGKQNSHSTQQQDYEPEKPERVKRKKKGCGCGCGTFLIILLLIPALLFGGLYSTCSKVNYVGDGGFGDTLTEYASKESSNYNVLLIGTDKDTNGTSRSDSMILVTIDKENKMLKFTSFMRDIWVDIPNHGEAKLNAAYAYGGADLLMQTIEENFNINIDNFVMVNFEMFEKLIDAMGGVTVDITEQEAEFINRTSHAKVTAGQNTLDGDYALIYCRIRKLDSDFMRTKRQRKVMTALFKQVATQNPLKTFKGVTDVLPLITTDISPLALTIKALSAFELLTYSNDEMRIPVDGTYSSRTIKGQSALVPDLEENREALQSFIYGN